MKKFLNLSENYNRDLLKNKLENNLILNIVIKCDFCNYIDEYNCVNNVAENEERQLAIEYFLLNGWDDLVIPEKRGISCPNCISKWKLGKWYDKV